MTEHFLERDKRKIFPHHHDGGGYNADEYVVEELIATETEKGGESTQYALKSHGVLSRRGNPRQMYHRSKNSFNDPLSVYFVLDAICESKRGIYLRPAYLVHYLNDNVPQIWWNNAVVGRIMAGFFHLCTENYWNDDIDNEYLKAHDTEQAQILQPFAMGRDSKGRFYVLDPEGGNEGLLWMLQARQTWLILAMDSIADDRDGRPGANWGKENAPTDYYMEHHPARARNAKAFRAQLGGAATFQRLARPTEKGLELGG